MKRKLAKGWTAKRWRELQELQRLATDPANDNHASGVQEWLAREIVKNLREGTPQHPCFLDFLESIARAPVPDGDE